MNETNQAASLPTIEQIAEFLTAYGWNFQETTGDGGAKRLLIADYRLESGQGVFISFRPEGEYVVVSTVNLLRKVPKNFAIQMLQMNDTIKLVKLYLVNSPEEEMMELDMGFELWAESWNKDTFAAFMDMLCLGIEVVLSRVEEKNIPYEIQYVKYE